MIYSQQVLFLSNHNNLIFPRRQLSICTCSEGSNSPLFGTGCGGGGFDLREIRNPKKRKRSLHRSVRVVYKYDETNLKTRPRGTR